MEYDWILEEKCIITTEHKYFVSDVVHVWRHYVRVWCFTFPAVTRRSAFQISRKNCVRKDK
jgi:hypothetical protein